MMKRDVKKAGRPAKRPVEYACPACYRPGPTPGYCPRCVETGGAAHHERVTGLQPPSEAPTLPRRPDRRERPAQAAVAPAKPPRKHAPSPRTTSRGQGNRARAGQPVSRQSPARDAALRLTETPGVATVLHTYQDEKRVKAGVWYLRHRVDLPPGFTFWRDGCDLVGRYDP